MHTGARRLPLCLLCVLCGYVFLYLRQQKQATMRIGQLARRLGIPPSDILGFLANNNIEAESGTNSRLAEDSLLMVVKHFAPEKASELLQSAEQTAPIPEATPEVQPVAMEEQPSVEEPVANEETDVPEAPVEVIRVAKVELQGLKVVGKIDLPQPKKKAEEDQSTEELPKEEQAVSEQPSVSPRPPRREFQKRTDRREQREWKNPMEQKRLQEAREAERKKQEQAERIKEKRTNHYYNKVKSVPTKAVRKVEEQTVIEELETKEPPKTIIGKFFRWLTT
jgi:hypothetical protein